MQRSCGLEVRFVSSEKETPSTPFYGGLERVPDLLMHFMEKGKGELAKINIAPPLPKKEKPTKTEETPPAYDPSPKHPGREIREKKKPSIEERKEAIFSEVEDPRQRPKGASPNAVNVSGRPVKGSFF